MFFNINLAKNSDSRDIFELSNDPIVRKNSINQKKIEWKEHCSWLNNKMANSDVAFYVVRDLKNNFIGYVRFDRQPENQDACIISVHLAQAARGLGLGNKIVKQTTYLALEKLSVLTVYAYVKEENIASLKCFEKADYLFVGKEEMENVLLSVMKYEK